MFTLRMVSMLNRTIVVTGWPLRLKGAAVRVHSFVGQKEIILNESLFHALN